tara:strand:+ start:253 stop:534 length:282 start_codon:yes stop_codon:yes gene_type:complete
MIDTDKYKAMPYRDMMPNYKIVNFNNGYVIISDYLEDDRVDTKKIEIFSNSNSNDRTLFNEIRRWFAEQEEELCHTIMIQRGGIRPYCLVWKV